MSMGIESVLEPGENFIDMNGGFYLLTISTYREN
jgi:hypothetical protein